MSSKTGSQDGPSPTATRRSRPRSPEATRAEILKAAVREFTRHGRAGARVDAIAALAKINKRMLYHYFGSKDELYLAVLETGYAGIRSAEAQLDLSSRDPIEAIRQLVLFTWTYFRVHPEFIRLLMAENMERARFLKRSRRIGDLNSPLIEEIGKILRRGETAGTFRPGVDPFMLYLSIASLAFFYLSNRYTLATSFSRDLMTDEKLEGWGEHAVQVILAFLEPD